MRDTVKLLVPYVTELSLLDRRYGLFLQENYVLHSARVTQGYPYTFLLYLPVSFRHTKANSLSLGHS